MHGTDDDTQADSNNTVVWRWKKSDKKEYSDDNDVRQDWSELYDFYWNVFMV